MKNLFIILAIIFILSCKEKHTTIDDGNEEPITIIFQEKNDKIITISNASINNEFDYYFEVLNEGIYTIDKEFNFEMLINKNAYLDRRYGNLLVFRYYDRRMIDNRGSYFIYDYLTKVQIDIPLNLIRKIKYISNNKIEISGTIWYPQEEKIITLDYSHNYIDKIIDYEDYGDTECIFNNLGLFDSISEIFNKICYFDLTKITKYRYDIPRLEIYYDGDHNVYYVYVGTISNGE